MSDRLTFRPAFIRALLTASATAAAASAPLAAAPGDAAREFPVLAEKIPFLSDGTLMFGSRPRELRYDDLLEVDEQKAVDRFLALAVPGAVSETELLALLDHPDGRVRTLALAASHLGGNPKILPRIAALADDGQAGIPSYWPVLGLPADREPVRRTLAERRAREARIGKRSVGALARRIVGPYLHAGGLDKGIEREGGAQRFADYWEPRKDREHCLSWFLVAKERARGSVGPMPASRIPRVKALRAKVDLLGTPYREWVLLAVDARPLSGDVFVIDDAGRTVGDTHLARGEELIAAAQVLGPEVLLAFLRGEVSTGDPDLDRGRGNRAYFDRTRRFILEQSAHLFRPEHAGSLLEMEDVERDWKRRREPHLVYAGWAAAAAYADPAPARAGPVLKAALQRFGSEQRDGGMLGEALWRTCGEAEVEFLKDLFFGDIPPVGKLSWSRYSGWLTERGDLPLLVAIVNDRRLDDLGWNTLDELVSSVNRALGREVVPFRELQWAWHPLGRSYDREKADAAKRFPAETAELEAHLDRWREALREALGAGRDGLGAKGKTGGQQE